MRAGHRLDEIVEDCEPPVRGIVSGAASHTLESLIIILDGVCVCVCVRVYVCMSFCGCMRFFVTWSTYYLTERVWVNGYTEKEVRLRSNYQ